MDLENRGILYYPCSENKGADQLRGYCEADLRLCFLLCRLFIFPCGGSYTLRQKFSIIICVKGCKNVWLELLPVNKIFDTIIPIRCNGYGGNNQGFYGLVRYWMTKDKSLV